MTDFYFNIKFRLVGQHTSRNSKISACKNSRREKLKWWFMYGVSYFLYAPVTNENCRN